MSLTDPYLSVKLVMSAIKACKAWKTKAQDVSSMTSSNNLTEELLTSETSNGDMSKANTFLDMNDLCDDSLEALIQHYLSLKKRMPNNLSVRERLVELQDEKFNRQKQQQEDNQ